MDVCMQEALSPGLKTLHCQDMSMYLRTRNASIWRRTLLITRRDWIGKVKTVDPDSDEDTNASHDNALGPAESWRLG